MMDYLKREQALLFKGLLLLVVGLGIGFGAGYVVKGKTDPLAGLSVVNNDMASTSMPIDMAPFWAVWRVLDEKYVSTHKDGQTVDPQERVWGAIAGLTSSLGDPYTVFMPPVEKKIFENDIAGNFEGVGMEIGIKNNQLLVVSPLKDSPAELAGIKAGDKIILINGISTVDMSVEQAVKLIRGKKGTTVNLKLLRGEDSKVIELGIIRDVINVPSYKTETKDGVFIIHLYNFYAPAVDGFKTALTEFINSDTPKLIIDMRGNPGGYLESAVEMASFFLPEGKLIVTEDFAKEGVVNVEYRSRGYDIFNDNLKMVILVDGGSASASEILAGALQDQKQVQLVGTKTFGKGSVQELVPITPDTSLKVTVARWLTPKGNSISETGITPDVVVELSEEDIVKNRDPQLTKAIELLNK